MAIAVTGMGSAKGHVSWDSRVKWLTSAPRHTDDDGDIEEERLFRSLTLVQTRIYSEVEPQVS